MTIAVDLERKATKQTKQSYICFNNTISCTTTNKYLGILCSASGTFTQAKKQLCIKSVKALYSLKRNIITLNPNINTSIHIFDHTINRFYYMEVKFGVFLAEENIC